jgi:hypothetical protein
MSAWHRIDAVETWHWYAGAPISLTLSPPDGQGMTAHVLGPDLRAGCRPQVIVPTGWWQTAVSLGAWTLVGCTVAPGFRFDGFELAPKSRAPVAGPPIVARPLASGLPWTALYGLVGVLPLGLLVSRRPSCSTWSRIPAPPG